jgi:hypothetical protein
LFEKEKQANRPVNIADIRTLMAQGELSVAKERYLRLRYGISEPPSHELQRIPMPPQTARVVEGLEAMLVGRMNNPGPSSLKRETIIDKLRKSKG